MKNLIHIYDTEDDFDEEERFQKLKKKNNTNFEREKKKDFIREQREQKNFSRI